MRRQEPGAVRVREVPDADRVNPGGGHWEDEMRWIYSGAVVGATSGGEVAGARELARGSEGRAATGRGATAGEEESRCGGGACTREREETSEIA